MLVTQEPFPSCAAVRVTEGGQTALKGIIDPDYAALSWAQQTHLTMASGRHRQGTGCTSFLLVRETDSQRGSVCHSGAQENAAQRESGCRAVLRLQEQGLFCNLSASCGRTRDKALHRGARFPEPAPAFMALSCRVPPAPVLTSPLSLKPH